MLFTKPVEQKSCSYFEQDQWQESFYGQKHRRVRNIKDALDHTGILCARTAVGSED